MRHVMFDIGTYNQTSGLEGGAVYTVVEQDIGEIQMVVDEQGLPTLGGLIGYYLASAVLAALIAYIFLVL